MRNRYNKFLPIAIYLTGFLVSYFNYKHTIVCDAKKWTVGERRFAIMVSCFSWFAVGAEVMAFVVINSNDKTPAKF